VEEEAGEKVRVDALADVGQMLAEMLARQEGERRRM